MMADWTPPDQPISGGWQPPDKPIGTSAEPAEQVYYNDAGQPFTLSGKPVPQQKPDSGYTGSLLPLRRDEAGLHLAVPEAVASPARGIYEGGKRAAGVGEQGQDPLRPLSPDISAAASLGADQVLVTGLRGVPVNRPPIPSQAQSLLRDFEKHDITPNVPEVGQGRVTGVLSQVGSYLPATAPVIKAGIEKTAGDTAAAAERSAAGFGGARTPEQAGSALQSGVTNFAKSVFPDKAEKLYDEFDKLMVGAPPAALDNTMKAMRGPMGRFPSSPELGAQLTNPKLREFSYTLAPKTKEIPAAYSSIVDAQGNPILVRAAQKVQSGGTLTFDELKELRSSIGRKLADPVLVSDIPRADLKSVYAGITRDLEGAARKQGPEALKAFQNASKFYKAGLDRIDRIEGILSGPPERAFAKINTAAQSRAGADAGLLRSVKRSMDPQEWREVGAAVIRKLGEPTPGAKDILAETQFSPSSFVTNWNKLSDAAKDALFGANVPDSARAGLETLARISQSQKNLGRLANMSRSAEHGITTGLVIEAARALLSGNWKELAMMAGSAAAGYGLAKLLMSPGFTRWLYRLPDIVATSPSGTVTGQRASVLLMEMMNRQDDNYVEPKPARAPVSTKGAEAMGVASAF